MLPETLSDLGLPYFLSSLVNFAKSIAGALVDESEEGKSVRSSALLCPEILGPTLK
jgi:hypothetical protein